MKDEGGSGAQDAVDLYGPFVQFQDLFGDGQPETRMPRLMFSALVQLVESVKGYGQPVDLIPLFKPTLRAKLDSIRVSSTL